MVLRIVFQLKDGKKVNLSQLYYLLEPNSNRTTLKVLEEVIWRWECTDCYDK